MSAATPARWGLPLAVAALGLAGWWLLSLRFPPVLLPGPDEVAARAFAARGQLLGATLQTALAAAGGLALAAVAGAAGGVLFLRSPLLERALYPYALLLQTLPIVAVAPLLIVWLGYGLPVALCAAAIVAFFPLLSGVHLGLRAVSRDQVELLRLYRATWLQELRLLRIPAALPHALAGLRTAGGLAVIGAIVGEFVGSNGLPPSLGFVVLHSARSADTGLTFAAIFLAALLALGFFGLTRGLERLLVERWHGEPPA